MGEAVPWVRGRGLGRLLAREINVSDFLQYLSDRDPAPWISGVGFVPSSVEREARDANTADLLLTSKDGRTAVVEVKLGHLMRAKQQEKYEALAGRPDLYIAALVADRMWYSDPDYYERWGFLSLAELLDGWCRSADDVGRFLASDVVEVLRGWDTMIEGVFAGAPLAVLNQKFLARIVTRRVANDLRRRGRLANATVTNGGGLPIVQAWTPLRNEGEDRTFMAEVRWWEPKPGGELRFGVDFGPRPGQEEDEEVRRAAFDLANAMNEEIDFVALQRHLADVRPELAARLSRDRPSRPKPAGDWERVITHGLGSGGRRRTNPGFYGDGALRFQAIAEIDFEHASASDVTQLIDATLTYLGEREPR